VWLMHKVFIHVYSCSSLLCTFCFCRVYVSGISSCPVHPVFFSLNKSVQFSSVQYDCGNVIYSSRRPWPWPTASWTSTAIDRTGCLHFLSQKVVLQHSSFPAVVLRNLLPVFRQKIFYITKILEISLNKLVGWDESLLLSISTKTTEIFT